MCQIIVTTHKYINTSFADIKIIKLAMSCNNYLAHFQNFFKNTCNYFQIMVIYYRKSKEFISRKFFQKLNSKILINLPQNTY